MFKQSSWIDLSPALGPLTPVWPGDPPVRLVRVLDLAKGDPCTVTALSLSVHAGAHLEGPSHYLTDDSSQTLRSVDEVPLAVLMGRARVVEFPDLARIEADQLRAIHPRRGERLLVKTDNSTRRRRDAGFFPDYAHLSAAAARTLAKAGVRLLGVDGFSVGDMGEDGEAAHKALLSAGVWIIEGLDLAKLSPGPVDFLCLPLPLHGAEAAPVRALARPRPSRRRP